MGVFYKVFGLMVALGLLGSGALLTGCGPEEVADRGVEMRADLPQAPLYDDSAPAIESSASLLVSGGFFGNSGFGSNVWECKSYGCYCDPNPGTDCKDMQKAGVCDPGSTLVCGTSGGRSICQCIKRGQMSVACPTGECPGNRQTLATGLWSYGGNIFRRLPDSDRTCYAPNALVPPGVVLPVATGLNLDSLNATYSFQRCTDEENDASTTMTSGLYQTPDTQLHWKVNRRSCEISPSQWGRRRVTPSITQQTAAQAARHRSYLGCFDQELRAGGLIP